MENYERIIQGCKRGGKEWGKGLVGRGLLGSGIVVN